MVVDNHFGNEVVHYLKHLIAQGLGKLAGIGFVDIPPAMVVEPFVVANYWMID